MMIPCSALLAAGGASSAGPGNETILINYMRGGGHYEWDQGIEDNAWRETAKRLIGRLRRRHKLAFLCHNQAEYQSAQELDSTLPRMWPKTPREYFDQASGCAVALCNRMHASVGLAGMGIPSVCVITAVVKHAPAGAKYNAPIWQETGVDVDPDVIGQRLHCAAVQVGSVELTTPAAPT
jgi:hypothetical protein